MDNLKSKISEHCDVSEKSIKDFYSFTMKNLFNQLPNNSTCELTNVYTTFSYLHMRYVIEVPNPRKAVLSFNLLGSKSVNKDKIFKDYLRADFAFLNQEMNKLLSGVRVFEGEFDKFRSIFYKEVIPMFNKL